MGSLPSVSKGLVLPREQPVTPGEARDYIGIYAFDDEPRLVITLTDEPLKFGKVENWSPIFRCDLPLEIETSKKTERFFQIHFTGIPGHREAFVSGKLCVRDVVVTAIKKMSEGKLPEIYR